MLGIYYNHEKLTKTHIQETGAQNHMDNPSLSIVTTFELFIPQLSINYIDLLLTSYLTIVTITKVTNANQSVTTSRKTALGKPSHMP